MVQEVKQTHQEKVKMYNKSKKKDLIEMLIEANRIINERGPILIHRESINPPRRASILENFSTSPLTFDSGVYDWTRYPGGTVTFSTTDKVTKLTLREAIRLSIMKWEHIVAHNGSPLGLFEAYPEFEELCDSCGLCELYKANDYCSCGKCPFIINDYACGYGDHPYTIWSDKSTKENAQAVLDAIKNIDLPREKKITLVDAVKFSYLKWKYIVKNNGSDVGLLVECPELIGLESDCGLCEFYGNCIKCPLNIKNKVCAARDHPWRTWLIDKTKANAQKVLDLINKIELVGKDTFLIDENNKVKNKDDDPVGLASHVPAFEERPLASGVEFNIKSLWKKEPKLTLKKAIKFSIVKWEYIVGNDGNCDGLIVIHPELDGLLSTCGLCEFYSVISRPSCDDCILRINGVGCGNLKHPHAIWYKNQTKENAQKMLDAIKDIQYVWVDISKKDGKKLNLNIDKPFKDRAVSVDNNHIIKKVTFMPTGIELYVDDKNEKKYKCVWKNGVRAIKKQVKRK